MTAPAEAALGIGLDLRNAGKAAEALPHLVNAVSLKPDWAQAQCALGLTYLDLGRNAEAEMSVRRAASLEPTFIDTQYLFGEIQLGKGQAATAVQHFRRLAAARRLELMEFARLIVALMAERHHKAIKPENHRGTEPVDDLVPIDGVLQEAVAGFHQQYWRFRSATDETVAQDDKGYTSLMRGAPYDEVRRWLLDAVRAAIAARGQARVIDFGCVTGPLLSWLTEEVGGDRVAYLGIEPMKDYARFAERRFGGRAAVKIVNTDVTGFNRADIGDNIAVPVDVFWAGGVFAYINPADLRVCLRKAAKAANLIMIRDYLGNAFGREPRAFMYNWRFPMFAHNYATMLQDEGFVVDEIAPSRSPDDKFGWGVLRASRNRH